MPAKQVADGRSGHALAAGMSKGAIDVVGDGVPEAGPKMWAADASAYSHTAKAALMCGRSMFDEPSSSA